MSKDKDVLNPSTTSAAWDAMMPKWKMIETLLGGTSAMRTAAQDFLPRHAQEPHNDYADRLKTTTLFNMTEITLNTWVGKPFSDPVELNDDVPEQIVDLAVDIDLDGNDITTFCRQWFRESLAKGFSHVLIDFPSITEEERVGRTLADDKNDNRRPYWNLIKPENLIFAASEIVNGQSMLTHVRLYQVSTHRVGFAEVFVEQIRVLEPGRFELWELIKPKDKRKKEEWVLVEQGETGLDVIPLVTFYADKDDLMLAKPPLEDLAFLNVRHWQSSSDQNNVLTVARFPLLAASGVSPDGDAMRIGPKQLLATRTPLAKFYYVEHTGKAIQAGAQDLQDLENQMASYGATFLQRKSGGGVATARALDSEESTSPLQDQTIRFIDVVASALDITAMWLGIKDGGGSVSMLTDFGPEEIIDADLRSLNEARRNRDLSRDRYTVEMMRRGVLADNFDAKQNLDELMNEEEIESPFATGKNTTLPQNEGGGQQTGPGQGAQKGEPAK